MKNSVAERKVGKNASNENAEDITKLPKYRLLEMLDRQTKLLNNRKALEKLPDKGDKVKRIKKQIEDELEKRNSSSNICEAMAGLALSAPQINALEWTKNIDELKKEAFNERLNECEENPVKILATHSGTIFSKKTIRVEEESLPPLITKSDIEEVYAMKLCDKIDKVESASKFLPHKTLNCSHVSKKTSSEYKPEDLCSASNPPSKFGKIKIVSLETSMKLQYNQAQHLKEVQLKHAAERLKDKTYKIGNPLSSHERLQTYRDPALINSESDDEENVEEEEVEDIEDECADEDREGTVTYQVTD